MPCAFLTFFSLASDLNTSSLQDNKLKSEINNIRSLLSSTNYKTKLVVILVGDGRVHPPDLEDRVNNLRRSTGLDGKGVFFLAHDSSPAEVSELVNSILSSLHPICVEYYRDLSKHARRKRNRNSVPQPTVQPGTAHVLSLQGWNVRYEFKLGVFAEFRQEMDAACRNYETAYDNLLAPEIIEAIAVWNPRFNEARLLADIIAFRTIRCLLWLDEGTTAVRSWQAHRERIRDLVNRRGKGIDNYGWEAWQSAWARLMADLLTRSQYPLLNIRISDVTDVLPIFAEAEKSVSTSERITPWEQVHHEGYWLDNAKRHTAGRRKWALQMPEEDRQSPGRSPASLVASKAHLYDTYLALEPYLEVPADGRPGYNYVDEIVSTLDDAIRHFIKRGQLRKKEILELQKALELIQAGSWTTAMHTLRPLWSSQSWRHAGWWKLLQGLGWALLDCLDHVRNAELLVQLLWELSNDVFDPKPGTNYDLRFAFASLSAEEARPSVAMDIDEALSPLVPGFAFSTHDVFVGEPLECQLSIKSRAQAGLPPVKVSEVKVVFEGGLKPVHLIAETDKSPHVDSSAAQFVDVQLDESSSVLPNGKRSSSGAFASQTGVTDLTMSSKHTKIFRFRVVPREAGETSIASITLLINDESFTLAATSSDFGHSVAQWWESKGGYPVPRTLGRESNAFNSINVQPKPPKLQIEAPGLKRTYYTNESMNIEFDIVNEEEDAAVVSIEARMISPVEGAGQLKWIGPGLDGTLAIASETGVLALPRRELGTIESSAKTSASLCVYDTVVAVDHEVEVVATYSLISEPETILSKSLTVDVGVIRPFEANYDFIPRLDDDEWWPNFFTAPPPDTDSSTPLGLRHLYSVTANLYSFAVDPLAIEAILLTATKIVGGAVFSSSTGIVRKKAESTALEDNAAISSLIQPDQTETFDFDLALQKLVLGDRHAVGVDLALEIGWRRLDSSQVNTTLLEVPKLIAPMAEPRVMLTTSATGLGPANVRAQRLTFMIENPSMHFLTFNVSLEASEDFAFSGPKACALSLVPISRQTLSYRILPNKTDEWIGVHLTVIDAYFGQTLKVLPGGEGVKVDKGNVFVKV